MGRSRSLAAAAAAASILLLAGCGGGDDTATSDACVPMTADQLVAAADGLTFTDVTLERGAFYPLPEADRSGAYASLAVMEAVTDGGDRDVVILATGDQEIGPAIAVGAVSRTFFTWGEAAEEGSPARDWADALYTSDTRETAEACLS